MRLRIITMLFYCTAVTAYADKLDFKTVLGMAHETEKSLSKNQAQELLSSQSKIMNKAMPFCFNKVGIPANFSIVVQINEKGKIVGSWLNNEMPFTLCFKSVMINSMTYLPVVQPFFTAIEYTNK
mgnify:CR=1 FL=1